MAVRFYHEVEEDIYITATLDLYIVTYIYVYETHTLTCRKRAAGCGRRHVLHHICSFALDSRIE